MFSSQMFFYLAVPCFLWSSTTPAYNADFLGILTLLPPFLAIFLSFVTRHVHFSLFVSLLSGSLLLASVENISIEIFYRSFDILVTMLIDVIDNRANASIIAQLLIISGLIALISKNGGAIAIANNLSKRAKTRCSVQIFACFTAICMFFDDYANCMITGPIMRPVFDKMKVSREKLAFIVDSMAAPIAGITLISTWIGYELSVIRDAYCMAGAIDVNAYIIFIKTLPYRFYNYFIIGFIGLTAFCNKEFGPMLEAEKRTQHKSTKNINTDGFEQKEFEPITGVEFRLINAILPISILILGTLFSVWHDGHQAVQDQFTSFLNYNYIVAILNSCDIIVAILKSAILASAVAIITSYFTKTTKFFQGLDIWLEGTQNLLSTVFVLVLAWSTSAVINKLGATIFLVQLLNGNISDNLLPILGFMISLCISFATGTSFGTMAILLPICVPLATSLSGSYESLITTLTTSAVLSGAIVGDHCSPISDTTILSSAGSGCSLMQHVSTQLPYGILITCISLIFGYGLTLLQVPIYICYLSGFICLFIILQCIGKKPE